MDQRLNDLSSFNILSTKRLKTWMITSDLCHYSDAYIVVKGTIDLLATGAN